jgi:BirA family transcriptional regulator, biotin operon repressor / biotin---[acetyl-CoA-carboxylase] ligase
LHKIFTNTIFIGKNIIYLPECHSTNDIAAEVLSKNSIFDGTVILTDHQKSGKGQRGNSWEAEPGKNLTFSIILKPKFLDISEQFFLNIIISLAIHDLLIQYLSHGLTIKWPNDIFYHDNKVGGILIESSVKNNQLETVIVGIGININQKSFLSGNAISLAMACNQTFDLIEILKLLLSHIENRYVQLKKSEFSKILNDYLHNLYWINEEHTFNAKDTFKGKIIGIDKIGRLMIETQQGIKYFNNKEIQFLY